MNDQAYKTMVQVDRKYGEKQGKAVQKDKAQKHRPNYSRMSAKELMSAEEDFGDEDYKMFDDEE